MGVSFLNTVKLLRNQEIEIEVNKNSWMGLQMLRKSLNIEMENLLWCSIRIIYPSSRTLKCFFLITLKITKTMQTFTCRNGKTLRQVWIELLDFNKMGLLKMDKIAGTSICFRSLVVEPPRIQYSRSLFCHHFFQMSLRRLSIQSR